MSISDGVVCVNALADDSIELQSSPGRLSVRYDVPEPHRFCSTADTDDCEGDTGVRDPINHTSDLFKGAESFDKENFNLTNNHTQL